MTKLTDDEINAIYCCISFSQDLRDQLESASEKEYWNKWDMMTKNIGTALVAAHKLAGYDLGVYKQ